MAFVTPLDPDRCSRADPKHLKGAVDRRLRALLPGASRTDELAAALRYSVLAPGKRLRPILTVLTAWEVGADDLRALDAGCALEMVHTASLILDDMPAMDDADERRGQPCTHIRFGEDVALLTAITLLNLAYGTMGGMRHVSSDARCRLIAIMAETVGLEGLAGGQLSDLRPGLIGGVQAAADANRRKTAALFEAAASFGAIIADAPETRATALRRCAAELGQAYQMLDDLIDSGSGETGERCEDADKATILSLIGPDAASRRLRNHLDAAMAEVDPAGPLASFMRRLFGALAATEMA